MPGGNVIANVIGLPAFFASSTIGLSACGVRIPFAFKSFSNVIACPLRLISKLMIIGFTGDKDAGQEGIELAQVRKKSKEPA